MTAVIEDDGAGFDPAETERRGSGLLGMRERLALLDGTLRRSSRQRGARNDDRGRGAAARERSASLIVDDHAVVRAGLQLLLEAEDDIEPVGEAGDAQRRDLRARALKPDVILMDVVDAGPERASRRSRSS